MKPTLIFSVAVLLIACGGPEIPTAAPPPQPPLVAPPPSAAVATESGDAATSEATPPAPKIQFTMKPIPLPGATGAVSMDYLACDRGAGRVWVPAGDTASVDVVDVATLKVTRIDGFPTVEKEMRGQKRRMGPSSATIGDGVGYVGNRANSQVCVVDGSKLTRGACLTLPTPPDGLQYVASAKELWVTTPRDNSLTILDASTPAKLKTKTKIALDGAPEGYAVDDGRGIFYTNLEDKDKTLVIDVKTHKVTATRDAQCGSDGPRGLALDAARSFLFVACTDHVEALDVGKDAALLSKIDTGAGVDNIDYLASKNQLYVAAGKAATLTVAQVDDKGVLTVVATAPTSPGARNAVVDRDGGVYLADGALGRILQLTSSP
jgi:DNA-binding beta-propeller fold protein YncE